MIITEEIKEEVMSDDEQKDLFYALANGKSATEEIETSRGKFIVKFPKQKDLNAIDRRVALMRGGVPADSFDIGATFNLQRVAYLDVCVVSGENWYNNLKKQNQNFSWGDMPDVKFVNEVYVKAWDFRNKIQKYFESDEAETDQGTIDDADVSPIVDNGLFSGVASSN